MIILDRLIFCFSLKLVQVLFIAFYYLSVNYELIILYVLFILPFITVKQNQSNKFFIFVVYFNAQIFSYKIMMYFFVINYVWVLDYCYFMIIFSFIYLIDNFNPTFMIFFLFVFLIDLLIVLFWFRNLLCFIVRFVFEYSNFRLLF